MSKILINEMSFYYAEYYNPVFEQVNLILDTDWRLGLTGRNGRGKTTLLKLLKGELEPVKGMIAKGAAMEYYPYEYETKYTVTMDVLKEIIGNLRSQEDAMETLLSCPTDANLEHYGKIQESYAEAGGYQIEGRIKKELYLMRLPEELLSREFAVLSGGERAKMLMIALFLRPNTFILMDEPTNHLDIRGKQAIAAYLKQKSGFLVASHDRQFLDEVSDHILAINKTDIALEKGNYSSWRENEDKKEAYEFRTRTRLEKEIAILEKGAVIRRNWAGIAEKEKNPYKTNNRGNSSRAAKFMRQAKTAELEARESIARKRELLKNYETVPELATFGQDQVADQEGSKLLLEVNRLTFSYGKLSLFQNFSMRVSEGDRIWIRGANGSGKSTLLRLIGGDLESESVKCEAELRRSFSYQEALWQDGFVRDRIAGEAQWARFLMLCSCLDITEELLKRPIQTFSSGEKKKTDVARALSEENGLLLLDEPLNYMDVYFREQLEKAVLALHPTLVFVEHDERFGSRVATQILNLDE